MNKIEWGPWHSRGERPNLGDLVNVQGHEREDPSAPLGPFVDEIGICCSTDSFGFTLTPRRHGRVSISRWRRGKPPADPIALTRSREKETV